MSSSARAGGLRRPSRSSEPLRAAGALHHVWTPTAFGTMHARVGGLTHARAAVVLVSGLVVSGRYMAPTAVELARDRPVYAPDLPGYGDSVSTHGVIRTLAVLADALAAWMDAVGLARAHLLGNSFGCQVLAELAVRHPERVDRLVLQGPTVDPVARSAWRQLVGLLRNSGLERRGLAWITAVDYVKAGPRRVIATVRMALRDRIESKLARVAAPTLVVRGERDPIVPQRWAEAVCDGLPHGRLRVLPGLGHSINYSAPGALAAAVRPFLGV